MQRRLTDGAKEVVKGIDASESNIVSSNIGHIETPWTQLRKGE